MTHNALSVAPSSGGSAHENPIVLPPGGTFELRLELPEGAHSVHEAWELVSTDGRYARRQTRADAVLDPQTAQMKLVFAGLYTDGSYTLVHHGAGEARIAVFNSVPYAELTEHGGETSAPAAHEAGEVESEPDVQAESQHPEVQTDPTLDELLLEDDDVEFAEDLPRVLAPPEDRDEDDDTATGLTNPSRGAPAAPGGSPPR